MKRTVFSLLLTSMLIGIAAAQTVTLSSVVTSSSQTPNAVLTYGGSISRPQDSTTASAFAAVHGPISAAQSGSLGVNWVITVTVPYTFGVTPTWNSGSYSFNLADSAYADAMNSSSSGSAHGTGTAPLLDADVSVGVGSDEDPEGPNTYTFSGTLTGITFTHIGSYWVGTKTITSSSLAGSATLSHPSGGYRLDGATGSGETQVSNLQYSMSVNGG